MNAGEKKWYKKLMTSVTSQIVDVVFDVYLTLQSVGSSLEVTWTSIALKNSMIHNVLIYFNFSIDLGELTDWYAWVASASERRRLVSSYVWSDV